MNICGNEDNQAREFEAFVKREGWCYKFCDHYPTCPVQGEPYTEKCRLSDGK